MKKVKVDKRPWGKFEQFTLNEKSTVKILTVNPKKKNSLQTHRYREEFWYALDNSFKAVVGNKTISMKKGDTVVIRKGVKHRMIGLGKPARILEIAFGKFNEKDIKRLEDDFGRK
jgi:mannose-1-phosphate guanylyltransferase/mannose-6-phosphate isomerase